MVVVVAVMMFPHLHFTFFENNIFVALSCRLKSAVGVVSVRPKRSLSGPR